MGTVLTGAGGNTGEAVGSFDEVGGADRSPRPQVRRVRNEDGRA
jgi:hypothetical protein